MSFGLDYVSGPSVADLKAIRVDGNPITFVCRYTGYFSGYKIDEVATQKGKVLTPGEAMTLSQHGIALVSNWEWSANRAVQGHDAGVWDAGTAAKIHHACGGPSDRPIYFSVDVDVAEQAVLAYFKGVAAAIGLHRTGAYGSYRVLHELFNAGAITWGWQTYAWSYGAWEPRAHIQQYENSMSMAGHSVDYNRSIKSDFGQWYFGQHITPQEETMTPLTIHDVKQYFKANTDGSWTRIDSKTGTPLLDSLNKPIILKGAILSDWCAHGTDALPDFGLPEGNETQVDAKNHPEIVEQQFERCTRRYDPHHVKDSPRGAGVVYAVHIENLYSAQTKLDMALEQLAAMQKQLAAATATSPESAYVAAVKEVDVHIKAIAAVIDPLAV